MNDEELQDDEIESIDDNACPDCLAVLAYDQDDDEFHCLDCGWSEYVHGEDAQQT